jgi:hypothetical protein
MSWLKRSTIVLVHAEAEFLGTFFDTTVAVVLTKKLLALHAIEQASGLAAITLLPELAVPAFRPLIRLSLLVNSWAANCTCWGW